MVWSWVLVGCLCGVLALRLQEAARPVASEVMASLRVMALRLGASPALSSPAEWPLLLLAHLTSLSTARGMLEDYDLDGDDAAAMLLLPRRPHVLSPVPVGMRLQSATYASLWPISYLVRPQLLSRL
jgi:hypothetical protein